ncbi:MAG: iron ABC transporter permease [Myxococcota bacterium]|nr:iron ABC transporter permease [Myxococcota bacterium]
MKHLGRSRFYGTLLGLAAALVGVAILSLALGPTLLSPLQVAGALFDPEAFGPTADIVRRIRLPRIALAGLVGACLSTSGVIFQALLRNPLADPFILGVSGGAALGGILVLSLGASLGLGYGSVPIAAFVGCLITTFLLYVIAGRSQRVSATGLLLTGVVFNSFASAAIVFMASLAGMLESGRIFVWLIGNLSSARIDLWPWLMTFLVLGLGCAMPLARGLNALALGEETAEQLGIATERARRVLVLATSLMVGAAVSVAGLVGFVGLIIPHLLRLVLGPDHRLLLPAAALGGAAFLILCDTIARTLLGGRELPVGAVTSLLGGPLFLYLLRSDRGRTLGSAAPSEVQGR